MTDPDPQRVAALERHLIEKGIHASIAGQVANAILVFHPEGGTIRVEGTTVQVIPKPYPFR